jgi:hypothetical protein
MGARAIPKLDNIKINKEGKSRFGVLILWKKEFIDNL